MKRISISIPYSVDLTKEKSWEVMDSKNTCFGIIRCHFQLNERIINEPHKVGEALAVYQSPRGVGHQHVTCSSFEIEKIRSVKSIDKFLSESEVIQDFAVNVATKIGFYNKSNISAEVKDTLVKKLTASLSSVKEIYEESKVRESISFSVENTIDQNIVEPIVAVPVYKRRCFDLLLGHVDFLKVKYERGAFSLRKKAKKYPIIVDHNSHQNVMKFGVPLASISYWEFLPNSSKLMLENDHVIEVSDSEEIFIDAPECTKNKFVQYPNVATLYQIASAAFPKKWIWRKSSELEWSEDELKKIETEEVMKLKNGWWKRNGN